MKASFGMLAPIMCVLVMASIGTRALGHAEEVPAGATFPDVARILFLGNSIALHGPYVAWTRVGGWGMAASAPEKDYVHLVAEAIAARTGVPLPIVPTRSDLPRWYRGDPPLAFGDANVVNIADIFERNYDTWDNSLIQRQIDAKPDVVVLQFGENMPPGDMETFKRALRTLLKGLEESSDPRIFVTSVILGAKPEVDTIKRELCEEAPGRRFFVDLQTVRVDASGAAGHPNDAGMQAIADAVMLSFDKAWMPKTE